MTDISSWRDSAGNIGGTCPHGQPIGLVCTLCMLPGAGQYPVTPAGGQTGWRCPGCGACYSPSVAVCFQCAGRMETGTAGTSHLNRLPSTCCDCPDPDKRECGYCHKCWCWMPVAADG